MRDYDLCTWYADVGDVVWYLSATEDNPVPATIISRESYGYPEDHPGVAKRYWIRPSNVRWYHGWLDTIRYWFHYYTDQGAYLPNVRWPGHAVEFGAEIYLNEEEAIEALDTWIKEYEKSKQKS